MVRKEHRLSFQVISPLPSFVISNVFYLYTEDGPIFGCADFSVTFFIKILLSLLFTFGMDSFVDFQHR